MKVNVPKSLVGTFCCASLLTLSLHGELALAQQATDNDVDDDVLEEVIVTGFRGALGTAQAQERSADQLKSIVSSDDIGNFADQNIAESLQRMPGVTINRDGGLGQQIAVRGLADSFVNVTVNGTRIGTRDPATRSVNLDLLSPDILSGIEVTKTLTPDLDADAIGGTVELKTLRAFNTGENLFRVRAEIGRQDIAEEINPRVGASVVRLFPVGGREDALGIAATVSWSSQEQTVDSLTNGRTRTDDATDGSGEVVRPRSLDLRYRPFKRERLNTSLAFDYRFNDRHSIYLTGTYAKFDEDDVRARTEVFTVRSRGSEILELSSTGGVFDDTRVEKRVRERAQEDKLTTLSFGGRSDFDKWSIDYTLDHSTSNSDAPSDEIRFREESAQVEYHGLSSSGVSFIDIRPGEFSDPDSDPTDPANFNVFSYNNRSDFTEDDVSSAKFDVSREGSFNDWPVVLQFGSKFYTRDRTTDLSRTEFFFRDVSTDEFMFTLADVPLFTPQNAQHDLGFLQAPGSVVGVGRQLRDQAILLQQQFPTRRIVENRAEFSTVDDSDTTEDIAAAYLMADVRLSDSVKVIAGVRVEDTDYKSSGSEFSQISADEEATAEVAAAMQAGVDAGTANFAQADVDAFVESRELQANGVIEEFAPFAGGASYSDVFPSLNVRYEPSDTLVLRASYTEGIRRPELREAAATSVVSVSDDLLEDELAALGGVITDLSQVEDVIDYRRTANYRRPDLDPMLAQQYDLSLSWYPSPNASFQVAFFYKDIEDFISRLILDTQETIEAIGLPFGDGTLEGGFDEVDTVVNGDKATVKGVELSYTQNFVNLRPPFDGLFIVGNATFADSEAFDPLLDRTFTLPEQADTAGNLSIGWENNRASIRVSGNYVDERLFIPGSTADTDILLDDRFSLDINARFSFSDNGQIYVDAINVNDATDTEFLRLTSQGGMVWNDQAYGATYQLGVLYHF